jgi:hypothetical protein
VQRRSWTKSLLTWGVARSVVALLREDLHKARATCDVAGKADAIRIARIIGAIGGTAIAKAVP